MITSRIRELARLAVDHLGPVTVLQLSCQLAVGMDDAEAILRCSEFARYPSSGGMPVYTIAKKMRRRGCGY